MTEPSGLLGWLEAEPGVVTGPRPPGTVTLADLADPLENSRIVDRLTPLAGTRRKAALTAIHYGVSIVVNSLVGPLALDHVVLIATADQLGVTIRDDESWASFWVGAVESVDHSNVAASAGQMAVELLQPVIAASRRAGRVGARGANTIALDALYAGCRRLERVAGPSRSPGWIDEFLAEAGYPMDLPQRLVVVHPDDGSAVELPIPTMCCVLSNVPSCHACPTCPLHPEDEGLVIVEDFLRSLDDDGFRYVTGRARSVTAAPGTD